MTGYLDEEALVDAYRAHDVCVLPSTNRQEAFGLMLLEGMAAGCVPVASDLPGVRDVARSNGMLVAPGDAQDLRWALNALAARPAWSRRLQTEAIEAATRQSWDAPAPRITTSRSNSRDRDRAASASRRRDWPPRPATTSEHGDDRASAAERKARLRGWAAAARCYWRSRSSRSPLAATLSSQPGSYVGDARLEHVTEPEQYLTRQAYLWDDARGLGKPASHFFSPAPAALHAALGTLGCTRG